MVSVGENMLKNCFVGKNICKVVSVGKNGKIVSVGKNVCFKVVSLRKNMLCILFCVFLCYPKTGLMMHNLNALLGT